MHITDFNTEEGRRETLAAPAHAGREALLTHRISHSPSPWEQPPGKNPLNSAGSRGTFCWALSLLMEVVNVFF